MLHNVFYALTVLSAVLFIGLFDKTTGPVIIRMFERTEKKMVGLIKKSCRLCVIVLVVIWQVVTRTLKSSECPGVHIPDRN